MGKKIQLAEKLMFDVGTQCEAFENKLQGHGGPSTFPQEALDQIVAIRYLSDPKWLPRTEDEKEAVKVLVTDSFVPHNLERNNGFANLEFMVDQLLEWATHYLSQCRSLHRGIKEVQRGLRRGLYQPGKPLYEEDRLRALSGLNELGLLSNEEESKQEMPQSQLFSSTLTLPSVPLTMLLPSPSSPRSLSSSSSTFLPSLMAPRSSSTPFSSPSSSISR